MISGSNTIPVILFRQVVDAMWKLKPRGGTTLCLAAALGCSVSFMEWIKEELDFRANHVSLWLAAGFGIDLNASGAGHDFDIRWITMK